MPRWQQRATYSRLGLSTVIRTLHVVQYVAFSRQRASNWLGLHCYHLHMSAAGRSAAMQDVSYELLSIYPFAFPPERAFNGAAHYCFVLLSQNRAGLCSWQFIDIYSVVQRREACTAGHTATAATIIPRPTIQLTL